MTKNTTKKGFTLIELLVVVAIIGTLSGIVMASLQNARKKTYNTVRNDNVMQIANALELYRVNNNNTLPIMPSATWRCVGLNNDLTTCGWGPAYTGYTGLFTNLTPYMKSGIPIDPAPGLIGGYTHYLYSSFVNYGIPGQAGAHLNWMVQNLGQLESSACGRGRSLGITGGNFQCVMFIGS